MSEWLQRFLLAFVDKFIPAFIKAFVRGRSARKADANSGAADQREADIDADTRIIDVAKERAAEADRLGGDAARARLRARRLRQVPGQSGGDTDRQGDG